MTFSSLVVQTRQLGATISLQSKIMAILVNLFHPLIAGHLSITVYLTSTRNFTTSRSAIAHSHRCIIAIISSGGRRLTSSVDGSLSQSHSLVE